MPFLGPSPLGIINSTVFEPIYFDCAGEASFDVAIFKLIK
jgi:hypothetical protein